jgi:hypothetical protein
MNTVSSNFTVADFCAGIERNEIRINRNYQRSDKVWPPAAKAALIETILLGYPIPKLFLHQVTDLRGKSTVKDIVDGQQRSEAILEFFQGKLSLSKRCELDSGRGKSYAELDEDDQQKFLSYPLAVDLFVASSPEDIRETFRRINSYTVPLNPEEQRHAKYQGDFKWFVHGICKEIDEQLLAMGVFGQKQLVRMADAKLVSDLVFVMIYGVKTTKKTQLDNLYRDYDVSFAEADGIRERLRASIAFLLPLEDIHEGPLMKPHVFYSLVIATMHVKGPMASLASTIPITTPYSFDQDIVLSNLSKLADALEADEKDVDDVMRPFFHACRDRTNVAGQRQTRIEWLCKALQPALL